MKQIFAGLACALLAACGYYKRPEPVIVDAPSRLTVTADFDDVSAAVLAAVRDVDMVIVSSTQNDKLQSFVLQCRNDEPANLRAEKLGGAIRLTASVGRFGDGAMERDLIRKIEQRLRSLHGRDSAPLPGYP